MQMEILSVTKLPPAADLPGVSGGEASSCDGRFVVRRLETSPTGVEGAGPYLAVSARTPYNRYPLPFMALSAAIRRDGDAVFEGTLAPSLDPDLHYHYGAALESLQSGDVLTLAPVAPPQVARHEAYETAFLDLPAMEFRV